MTARFYHTEQAQFICFLTLILTLFSCFENIQGKELSNNADLTSISDIRALPESQAAAGLPVTVEATITYADPLWNFIFVEEDGQALFVHGIESHRFTRGQRVLISGRTTFDLNPLVECETIHLANNQQANTKFPYPAKESKLDKDLDCRLLQCKLRVDYVCLLETRCMIVGSNAENERIYCSVTGLADFDEAESLVGAKIQVTGALGWMLDVPSFYKPGTSVNEPEIFGPQIFVHSVDDLEVKEAGDPKDSSEALRIHGQITLVCQDFIVLEANSVGKRVAVQHTHWLSTGQAIEAAVCISHNEEESASLVCRALRPLFSSSLPQPLELSSQDTPESQSYNRRVKLRGLVKDITYKKEGVRITVNRDSHLFAIDLYANANTYRSLDLSNVKSLSVTGVMLPISESDKSGACEFVVATQNIEDIEVTGRIRNIPWWEISIGSILFLLLFTATMIWVRTLRFIVRERTRSLSEINAYFHTAFEAFNSAVVAADENGCVVSSNQHFKELFGACNDSFEIGSCSICAFLSHRFDEASTEDICNKILEDPHYEGEVEIITSDTSPKIYIMNTAPIVRESQENHTQERTVIGRIWSFRDVTEARELEAELLQAQKLEIVGTLAAGFAHDFNNILSAAANNLSALELAGLYDTQQVLLKKASANVFRAADVARRLLTFSGSHAIRKEFASINEIIEESYHLVSDFFDSRVRIELSLAENAGDVLADKFLIQQVLLNLCLNARDAIEGEGKILLRTYPHEKCSPYTVQFSVADNGSGIPDELIRRIYDPFVTTKSAAGGSGLGLTVSYRVIDQHGGKIRCKSIVDDGTVFFVTLPSTENGINAEQSLP